MGTSFLQECFLSGAGCAIGTDGCLAFSKALRKDVLDPGSGWESPSRRSASPVELGVPLALMVAIYHTSLLP